MRNTRSKSLRCGFTHVNAVLTAMQPTSTTPDSQGRSNININSLLGLIHESEHDESEAPSRSEEPWPHFVRDGSVLRAAPTPTNTTVTVTSHRAKLAAESAAECQTQPIATVHCTCGFHSVTVLRVGRGGKLCLNAIDIH